MRENEHDFICSCRRGRRPPQLHARDSSAKIGGHVLDDHTLAHGPFQITLTRRRERYIHTDQIPTSIGHVYMRLSLLVYFHVHIDGDAVSAMDTLNGIFGTDLELNVFTVAPAVLVVVVLDRLWTYYKNVKVRSLESIPSSQKSRTTSPHTGSEQSSGFENSLRAVHPSRRRATFQFVECRPQLSMDTAP
jgi:hypothetical protein